MAATMWAEIEDREGSEREQKEIRERLVTTRLTHPSLPESSLNLPESSLNLPESSLNLPESP